MYRVSDRFLGALRNPHTVVARVDAWSGARLILRDVPFSDGSVSVSSGTGVRRKLDLTVPDTSLWDVLSPVGVELRAWRGIRFPDGTEELVPLGVFSLDQQSRPVRTGGGISISSAPDRFAFLQRARFETPRVSESGLTNVEQIIRLAGEVVDSSPETGGLTTANPLRETKVAVLVWDKDRDKAIQDLATAAGVEAFYGPTGQFTVRDVAVMDTHPVWRIRTGPGGVMVSGTSTRDRTRVYNVVVVVSTKTDGVIPFPPQIVEDTDPLSPTNVNGPYERCPYFLSTATLGTAADAYQAGKALLAKVRGRFIDMTVETVVNPALDSGDTVSVATEDGNSRLYLLDSFPIPLGASTGTQSLTLRSLAAVSDTTTSSS